MKHNLFWYFYFLLKAFATPIVAALVWILPRDKNKIAMGAWMGRQFNDNPKYLLLYLLTHSQFHITWIGSDEIMSLLPKHPHLSFARKGSLKAFWVLLRARVWVSCQNKESDLTVKPIYSGALRLNLWHGIPIKGMGELAPAEFEKRTRWKRPIRRFLFALLRSRPDWTIVSNRRMGEIMVMSFPEYFSKKKLLPCGYPRNDFLIKNKTNHEYIINLKRKYGKLLGFNDSLRIILYLPTYRINKTNIFSFYGLSLKEHDEWETLLAQNNAVIIEKHHPVTYASMPPPSGGRVSKVITPKMQSEIDTQELLLIADLLICDYTSAYIDYSLLEKPCIHYAADIEEYYKDSGLMYRYEDVVSGNIVKTTTDLRMEVARQLSSSSRKCGKLLAQLVEYEHGTASEQILRFVRSGGKR